MTSKLLELDQTQIDAILDLASDEVIVLNEKIQEAVNQENSKEEYEIVQWDEDGPIELKAPFEDLPFEEQ